MKSMRNEYRYYTMQYEYMYKLCITLRPLVDVA